MDSSLTTSPYRRPTSPATKSLTQDHAKPMNQITEPPVEDTDSVSLGGDGGGLDTMRDLRKQRRAEATQRFIEMMNDGTPSSSVKSSKAAEVGKDGTDPGKARPGASSLKNRPKKSDFLNHLRAIFSHTPSLPDTRENSVTTPDGMIGTKHGKGTYFQDGSVTYEPAHEYLKLHGY